MLLTCASLHQRFIRLQNVVLFGMELHEQGDGSRTNRCTDNIMPPPATLAWCRHKKTLNYKHNEAVKWKQTHGSPMKRASKRHYRQRRGSRWFIDYRRLYFLFRRWLISSLSTLKITHITAGFPINFINKIPQTYLTGNILQPRQCHTTFLGNFLSSLPPLQWLLSIAILLYTYIAYVGWLRGTVGRMSVFDRQTFAVLRSTCGWRVTTYVGKPSAVG